SRGVGPERSSANVGVRISTRAAAWLVRADPNVRGSEFLASLDFRSFSRKHRATQDSRLLILKLSPRARERSNFSARPRRPPVDGAGGWAAAGSAGART